MCEYNVLMYLAVVHNFIERKFMGFKVKFIGLLMKIMWDVILERLLLNFLAVRVFLIRNKIFL
jgi:hypothetical protein